MSLTLEGKSCLVTGGTRGIGKAIVMLFAELGADVALTYARSADAAEAIKKEIEGLGRKAMVFQADASDTAQAQQVIDEIVSAWGKLDVLVNNAGITKDNLILRMNEEQWDAVINTNLKSVFNYSKAATKPMMRNRGGSIINISSVVGISGNAGQTNYSASKAGIIGFSKSLAKELGKFNVNVNAVAPGLVLTEMMEKLPAEFTAAALAETVVGRFATPEDVAHLVCFLCSDRSRHITGEVIKIDGGQYI